jgi:lysophospholipase L1-like esterase
VIGDSIAIGVSGFRPACSVIATKGISSAAWEQRNTGAIQANKVLISLGSNDSDRSDTERSLRSIRSRLLSAEVTWLLSANNRRASEIARSIARERGDRVIDVRMVVGPDGVHPTPTGYHRMAAMWKSP